MEQVMKSATQISSQVLYLLHFAPKQAQITAFSTLSQEEMYIFFLSGFVSRNLSVKHVLLIL